MICRWQARKYRLASSLADWFSSVCSCYLQSSAWREGRSWTHVDQTAAINLQTHFCTPTIASLHTVIVTILIQPFIIVNGRNTWLFSATFVHFRILVLPFSRYNTSCRCPADTDVCLLCCTGRGLSKHCQKCGIATSSWVWKAASVYCQRKVLWFVLEETMLQQFTEIVFTMALWNDYLYICVV
jgi:hypothetical protein